MKKKKKKRIVIDKATIAFAKKDGHSERPYEESLDIVVYLTPDDASPDERDQRMYKFTLWAEPRWTKRA